MNIWVCEECASNELIFDRSLCACGLMHYFCGGCGRQDDECNWQEPLPLVDVEPID